MQVSAQPRFIDHTAHSVYNRGSRRAPADGGSRRFNDRSEDERRRTAARPTAEVAQIASIPVPGPEALWATAGLSAPPAAPISEQPPASQAESLYLLLSQVVGDL